MQKQQKPEEKEEKLDTTSENLILDKRKLWAAGMNRLRVVLANSSKEDLKDLMEGAYPEDLDLWRIAKAELRRRRRRCQ